MVYRFATEGVRSKAGAAFQTAPALCYTFDRIAVGARRSVIRVIVLRMQAR